MFEYVPVFLIYVLIFMVPLALSGVFYYIGVFALYCVYRHNGGKYSFSKYIETRNLEF